jgi:hypothetical protein
MPWTIERSDDQISWKNMVSFVGSELARRAFDLELIVKNGKYVRLLAPDGQVQERACTEKLPDSGP